MKIHRMALTEATDAQLTALRDKVLSQWKHIPDDGVEVFTSFGTLMVALKAPDQERPFVVGIEKDGYTHS